MSVSKTDSRKAGQAQHPVRRAARSRLPRALLFLFLLTVGTSTGPVSPVYAAAPYGVRALAVAASKEGAPYARGATGPKRFDCSGLTLYSFRKAGRRLPRTADQQYENTSHISRRNRTPGDLVFFPRGSTMEHVGIYAGNDKIWHAPRPGTRVRLERIWSRNVRYGRAS
ncbi:NlpC/P60 family protein [Streptomyces sp. NPDC048269]|uniref:C40 family peptidase n=1 Tax=Streptomyces sp. NPDC048269 TaxID=3155753 RepID=UPI003416D01A